MRITGGVHRSRELRAPKGHKTRPTADRVREGLFSMLTSRRELVGTHVLDLFAGTGALGLEALSRGVAHATFVESGREALVALRENVRSLGLEARSTIVGQKVERAIDSIAGPFGLVFCDPPYALVREPALSAVLVKVAGLCEPEATLVLEHDSKDAPPELGSMMATESRRYGDTSLTFYMTKPSSNDEDGHG
jgi:16S rRNA (guanine966-N2)-methyltransferase